jgi:hypothetical protein
MRILGVLLIVALAMPVFGQATAAGQCEWCQANEASATVTYVVGPGDYVYQNDPGCDSDTNTAINQLVQAYANSQVPGISLFAGPFLTDGSSQLGNAIKQNVGGSLGDWLQVFTGQRTANCAVMAVAMPAGSQYTAYRYEAREAGGGWQKCPTGTADCPIGWSACREPPNVRWTNNGGIAVTTFKNWSGDRTREARFTVYFVPPTNTWAPPR